MGVLLARLLLAWLLLAWLVLGMSVLATGPAAAQTPSPEPGGTPVQEERTAVEGAANPLAAPLLVGGTADDTILQSEVLWYALDVAPGQQVTATVQLVGRPDSPTAQDTTLFATLTDAQRQPLVMGEQPFDGTADATIALPMTEIPPIVGEQPQLSVALRSDGGVESLEGTGYRLRLTVGVTGEALPLSTDEADAAGDPSSAAAADVTVTSAPVPEPDAPDVVADVLPFAIVALAVGGFAGFELSRRGL